MFTVVEIAPTREFHVDGRLLLQPEA